MKKKIYERKRSQEKKPWWMKFHNPVHVEWIDRGTREKFFRIFPTIEEFRRWRIEADVAIIKARWGTT